MNRFNTDVRLGLRYELQGDYYVIAGEGDERPTVGIWGQRHLVWPRHLEQLKAENSLEWVQRMNSIKDRGGRNRVGRAYILLRGD